MPSISVPAAIAIGAGVSAVGGVATGLIGASASKSAASQQANAANQSAALQEQQYQTTRNDLMPYNLAGQNNLGLYQNFYQTSADQLGQAYSDAYNHIPQGMTEANLIQTPGYQFNLSQGLRAMQNSSAAKGLGVSGAAMQGAGTYATGLADSTYQNQFNNQQQIYNDYLQQAQLKGNQLNSIYGQISAPVTMGENAAAQTGTLGAAAAGNAGNSLQAAGSANAAGTLGVANNISSGINTVTSSIGNAGINYLGLQNALNNNTTKALGDAPIA